jgi:hypothetical protein
MVRATKAQERQTHESTMRKHRAHGVRKRLLRERGGVRRRLDDGRTSLQRAKGHAWPISEWRLASESLPLGIAPEGASPRYHSSTLTGITIAFSPSNWSRRWIA